MQLYEKANLVFLWSIPFFFLIYWWGRREWTRRIARLGNFSFIQSRLMPEFSSGKKKLGAFFLVVVFLFSVLALARPQWGEEKKQVERKGVDIIFLLDTSLSMLAEDIKSNRLVKSKLEIKNLLRRLKGDRVGMVAFAGSSFLQCPLTLDYSAFLLFVDALKPGFVPDPGTSLSQAIDLGVRAFPEESKKYRSMIVFSDGEDHEGGIKEAIEEAQKAGVRVYTIGVGTTEGEPIPLYSATDQKLSGYKKDRDGQIVITRLNPDLLREVADQTGGLYLPATAGEKEVELVLKHLETLGERRLKERLVSEREDHFQLFLIIAFLLLMGETLQGNRKKVVPRSALLPLLALIFLTGWLDSPHSLVKKGNRLAEEKKYQSAVESYRKAEIARPKEPVVRYNLGTTLYQLDQYRDAEKELEEALNQAKDPQIKAQALYNYGNTKYRLGDFEKAIEAYKKVLDLNPKDQDAKYNLEFLQKKKSAFEKKNQDRQKQKQNQEPNQQQQKNRSAQQPKPEPKQQGGQGQEEQPQPQSGNQKQEQGSQGEAAPQEEEGGGQQENQQGKQGQENKQPQAAPSGQENQKQEEEQGKIPQPMQGQMSLENAVRILDALRQGEKELQDLRRPAVRSEPREVLKDW